MRKLLLVLALFAVGALCGCGSDKDRGAYRDQDRPRSAPGDRDR
jgi:hypothetical protein